MASFNDQFKDVEPKYLEHAAAYFAARGLTVTDFKLLFWVTEPKQWFTAGKGNATEMFHPEGWAFDLGDGHYQMRICNWPDKVVYCYEGNGENRHRKAVEPMKFLSTAGCNNVVMTSSLEDIAGAALVMVHEKIASAVLCTKISGYPSITILGCNSWSSGKKMSPDFKRAVMAMKQNAKLAICFDRDIENGLKGIGKSASLLRYEVSKLRPDIEVVVFRVPTGGATDGFDDWMAAMADDGARAVELNALLQGEGLSLKMPAEFWVENFHLGYIVKNKEIVVESNQDTYERLFRGVPPWSNIYKDICAGYYFEDGTRAAKSIDDLATSFKGWLYEHIWKSTGVRVNNDELRSALRSVLDSKPISVAIKRIEQWPPVSAEEADEAAELLVTKAIEVYGPHDKETTKEIFKRIARDMCYLWEPGAPHEHIQWVLALIGPQGCGKSSFLANFCGALATEDFKVPVSPVPLKEEDAIRACRDNLIGIFDDWHNMDRADAKKSENIIFKLSTMGGNIKINIKYKEDFEHAPRHAALVLTTTDNNTQFLHSSSGAGERRFICLQVRGVLEGPMDRGGKRLMVANHELVQHCGRILLRWGLQLMQEGATNPANEWSLETIDQFQADEWAFDDMAENPNSDPLHREKMVRDLLDKWHDADGRPCTLLDPLIAVCRNTGNRLGTALKQSYLRVFMSCGMSYSGEDAIKIQGLGTRRRVLYLPRGGEDAFIAKLFRH